MRLFDSVQSADVDRRELQLTALACCVICVLAVGMAVLMYPVVFLAVNQRKRVDHSDCVRGFLHLVGAARRILVGPPDGHPAPSRRNGRRTQADHPSTAASQRGTAQNHTGSELISGPAHNGVSPHRFHRAKAFHSGDGGDVSLRLVRWFWRNQFFLATRRKLSRGSCGRKIPFTCSVQGALRWFCRGRKSPWRSASQGGYRRDWRTQPASAIASLTR